MDCPGCRRSANLAVWLDGVHGVSSTRKWLSAACPSCGREYEFMLEKGRAIMGSVDGGPAPVFIPDKTYPQPGLSVRWEDKRVHVRHDGRVWTMRRG